MELAVTCTLATAMQVSQATAAAIFMGDVATQLQTAPDAKQAIQARHSATALTQSLLRHQRPNLASLSHPMERAVTSTHVRGTQALWATAAVLSTVLAAILMHTAVLVVRKDMELAFKLADLNET